MPPLMPKPRYGSQGGDAYIPLVDQNPELDTAYYPPRREYEVEGMQPPLYGQPLPPNDGMVNKPLMSGDQDRVYDLRTGGGRTPSPTPSEVMALNGEKPPLTLKRKISERCFTLAFSVLTVQLFLSPHSHHPFDCGHIGPLVRF